MVRMQLNSSLGMLNHFIIKIVLEFKKSFFSIIKITSNGLKCASLSPSITANEMTGGTNPYIILIDRE